jgi:23S rRNA (cytosine1962-C5)-methyltransferase
MSTSAYRLLDSGHGRKLEQFGAVRLDRPCAQAVWAPQQPASVWKRADASFHRDQDNVWRCADGLPASWVVEVGPIRLHARLTDFGHVGLFPEHRRTWDWMQWRLDRAAQPVEVLNLFAYTGGATMALARAGARVCHLDASKKSVGWARENAALNRLDDAPVRWIIDDAVKFLRREQRRGRRYHGILLDPPSFGRGARQELFKIQDDLARMVSLCRAVLDPQAQFLVLTCHTPGYTPLVLQNLLHQAFDGHGRIDAAELLLEGDGAAYPVPSGAFAAWEPAP